MLELCDVVESFHPTRGVRKKKIHCTDKLGPPRVEPQEFVGQVIGQLILGVMLDKQLLGPPLEPNNYGGIWTFPSADVAPPCPPQPHAWVNPRRWKGPIEVPDQNYADARGNVVFSCLHNTTANIPRNPVAAVVPSVDIHFLPRPYWSDRKLRTLLKKMQSFPSLKGARPDLATEGGIELPQSAEQRTAFGTASEAFGEKDTANVCGFSRSFHYDGHADEWRKLLKDDRPHHGWLMEGRGYRSRDWSTGADAAANSRVAGMPVNARLGSVRAHPAADARSDESPRGVWPPADRHQFDACRAFPVQGAAVLLHQRAAGDDGLRAH